MGAGHRVGRRNRGLAAAAAEPRGALVRARRSASPPSPTNRSRRSIRLWSAVRRPGAVRGAVESARWRAQVVLAGGRTTFHRAGRHERHVDAHECLRSLSPPAEAERQVTLSIGIKMGGAVYVG